MMMVAVLNNLPEIIVGLCFSGVVFWLGRRYERWRTS